MRRILFIVSVFSALMDEYLLLWPPSGLQHHDRATTNGVRIQGLGHLQSQSFGGFSCGPVGLAGACVRDPFGGLSSSNIRELGLRFGARSLLYTNGYRFGLAMIF
ncbi:hypothetical protein PGT21_000226 [Puccinia graminis f. sp. tritici]|uniref:Secreted protein n=1 Tax=Puccinia graminis f. sp. tritici TaxID=56615 RepID=A0A5B0Q188_PUCGR|nr:hypothetical protein PGT21_000226 [Puccinia graminis f. sp. tritici]